MSSEDVWLLSALRHHRRSSVRSVFFFSLRFRLARNAAVQPLDRNLNVALARWINANPSHIATHFIGMAGSVAMDAAGSASGGQGAFISLY